MQVRRLQDLCLTEISDGTHQTPTYTEDKVNGYKFLSSKDVTTGKIDWQHIKYIPEELHNELYARIAPRRNDILLAKNGTTGVAAIVDCDEVFDIYVSLALIRPDTDKVIPKYLLYAINSTQSKEYFNRNLKGIGVPNLHLKQIRETPICVPSFSEQKHIIAVLDKIYALIEQRKEQLLQLDNLVKSRFIELFGDPINNPKGLPVKTLKQLSTLITNGNTPKGGSENYVADGVLFIRSQNVWRNRIDLEDVAYIDETTHLSMKKSIVKHKDILITKTGRINTENSSLGRAALYLGEDNSANINGHVYLVRLDGSVVPEFVITILTSEEYRKYIRKVCVGGIDKRQINLDQVEEFPIILPPVDQQTKFASFVEHTDKLKLSVAEALSELETLKKSLMQTYFT